MADQKQIKKIERASKLEEFLEGDIIEVRTPETVFSFVRGIHKPDVAIQKGRIFERKEKSMTVLIREYREAGDYPVIRIQHYRLSDTEELMVDCTTPIRHYDLIYVKYNKFLREANL